MTVVVMNPQQLLFCLTPVHFNIILHPRRRNELKTQKLLDFEIRGFQDELTAFIMDDVLSKEGSFGIARAKDKKSF